MHNNELQTQFQKLDIIEGIAAGILTWTGHIQAYKCLKSGCILPCKIQLFYKHLIFDIMIRNLIKKKKFEMTKIDFEL